MTNYIYYRILGYLTTIVLHGGNLVYISRTKPKEVYDDPMIAKFEEMRLRFLTGWTFILQTVFAIAGLLCDLLTLWNSKKKNYKLPKYLRRFRNVLFCSLLWPSVLMVFSIFWTVYSIDRSLIFPEFLDKIICPASNHIMHTAILPLAIWEVLFQPRKQPRSHVRYIAHGVFYFFLYFSVLFYTYLERGSWIYPVIDEVYKHGYLPIVVTVALIVGILWYFIHWALVFVLWRNFDKPTDKKKTR